MGGRTAQVARRLAPATALVAAIGLVAVAAPARADDASSAPTLTLTATAAVSERPFTLSVTSATPLAPGETVTATWTDPATGAPTSASTQATPEGTAAFLLSAWKMIDVTVATASSSAVINVPIAPRRKPVVAPPAAPSVPDRRTEVEDPAAIGRGANARYMAITPQQRKAMIGISWRPGCVPLSQLREVHVNYWGVDGYRHRGVLIARADVAPRVAKAFTALYDAGVRFHSIHPVDVYGRTPGSIGANDYASMAAGNTSMFNCRYQVGKERRHVWSPHAYGTAIDLNPWENPYVSAAGIVPDAWWYSHRYGSPLVHTRGSKVVRILSRYGWRWAVGDADLHHFDWRG